MPSSTLSRIALSGALVAALAVTASAQVIGSISINNANHGDFDFGSPDNTIAYGTPSTTTGSTFRSVSYSGTLTPLIAGTYASEAQIDFFGAQFASPQYLVQLSTVSGFTTPLNFSGVVYAPGGIDATQEIEFDYYDTFDDGVGADSQSSTTFNFNAGYGSAFSVEENGTLSSSSPTYTRASSTTALSTVGTSVYYNVQEFTVATTGSYTFANAGSYDTYLSLYSGAFDPNSALSGLLAVNDESGGVLRGAQFGALDPALGTAGTALITQNLTAGTKYFLVTSSYTNGETGFYTNAYVGPGAITLAGAVPEPATLAALGLGLPLLAARRRRKTSK